MASTANPKTNRHAHRRIAAAADAVGRVTDGDARFFARRADRTYRIRLLSPPEFEQMTAMGGRDTAEPGERWAVAVRQIAPGVRFRHFFTVPEGTDFDQPEVVCRATFARLTNGNPAAQEIERQLVELAKKLASV